MPKYPKLEKSISMESLTPEELALHQKNFMRKMNDFHDYRMIGPKDTRPIPDVTGLLQSMNLGPQFKE
jgi:hypothetical protein